MSPANSKRLTQDVIQAFDKLNGSQPGYRPAHAKGILLGGTFTPAATGAALTRAPHLHRLSTPVTVRFSDFAGIPSVADNDPNASPRGIAIRFHLAEHVHTDIIAHSVDGFPARTAEEFVEFLSAIYQSGTGAQKPLKIETFLASHPAALAFVQVPKPVPASFTTENFYAVNAYRVIDDRGNVHFGRYRIVPECSSEHLDATDAAAKPPDYLFDELKIRLARGPARLRILVQLAAAGDVVDDSTVHWPADRPTVEFGSLELSSVLPDNQAEQRHIIFDPIPRVDGIAPSGDPLLEPRADVYLATGRRRRSGK